MLYVGRASPEEIDQIVQSIGQAQVFDEKFPKTWRPSYLPVSGSYVDPRTRLNAETNEFLRRQLDYTANPKNSKYTHYQMNRPKPEEPPMSADDPFIH